MSGLKAIRRRITSVKNTRQITRAMKLVSAAKLRRAQDAAINGRSYSLQLKNVLASLATSLPAGFSNPLLKPRDEIKTRRIVVISGERGLCGPYNSNVIKAINANDAPKPGVNQEFVAIGSRTVASANRFKWNLVGEYQKLPENAEQWPIEKIISELVEDFTSGKCDEVILYYTKFISGVSQEVVREVFLPFNPENFAMEGGATLVGAKTDPSASAIMTNLLPIYLNALLRQAGLESKASEHAARMTAMDSATSNAGDLIDRLKLFYNRARQSTITRELIDIVGGAEAIK